MDINTKSVLIRLAAVLGFEQKSAASTMRQEQRCIVMANSE
jgi:hypothetical protein